jgi:DNA adenine methylase
LSRFLFIFSITPNVCLEPKVCARSAPFGGRSGLNKVGSLLRYPGGKAKLLKPILFELLRADRRYEYREPFFGGGAVGLSYLAANPDAHKIWLNDKDPGIASLWTAVMWYPDDLKDRIRGFQPTLEAFLEIRERLRSVKTMATRRDEIVQVGFEKLAIHRMSYSGLGTMAGGPLGGRKPKSEKAIGSRWNPDRLCATVDARHERLAVCDVRHASCTCLDFGQMIQDDSCPSVIYLDPPYYDKGNELYQHSFARADHERLAKLLRTSKHRWVLSYDDCPEIRKLYGWANLQVIDVNYSITACKNRETGKKVSRTKRELLILRDEVQVSGVSDRDRIHSPGEWVPTYF